MPLARIDLPAGKPADYERAIADVVYKAMIATLNAPKDDRFQVISEHTPKTLSSIRPISASKEAPMHRSSSSPSTKAGRSK